MKLVVAVLSLALLAAPAGAQTPVEPPVSSPQMLQVFKEDQADRNGATVDWSVVGPRDEQRRATTRKLLADGALHTAEDFRAAAFVFQHGGEAGDYLLAHSLAMVAVGKGDRTALWIASATLDRYLQTVGQKQIYGTQFTRPRTRGASWTQEPYDHELISDALRRELRVPTLATQAKEFEARESMRKAEAARP
jgi:hypothetical protein